MDGSTSRDANALARHPGVKAYSKDVAKRLARAHRARPDGSDAATETFLAEVADGLERWEARKEDADDPDDAAAGAERAAAAGDTSATIDLVGRAMAGKGRRVMLEVADAETALGAGPLTLFFVEPGTLVTNDLLSEAAGHPKEPVLDPGAPLPPGLEPAGGYLVERVDGFDPRDPSTFDIVSGCVREGLGIEDFGYAVQGGLGLPLLKKERTGAGGRRAIRRTSVASVAYRQLFPQRLPFRVWAPTWKNRFSTTASLGGVVGRWLPLAGWALLAVDVYRFGQCLSRFHDRFDPDDAEREYQYP